MICKKCGKEIPENETFCGFCGATVNEEKKPFKLNIQDEDFLFQGIAMQAEDISSNEPHKADKEQLSALNSQEAGNEENENPVSESITEGTVYSETEADETKEELQAADESNKQAEAETVKQQIVNKVPIPSESKRPTVAKAYQERKDSPQAIKADKMMKIIVCICAIIISALAIVSIETDAFKSSGNQTVALSKLSSEQVTSFEEYASKLSALYETEYDSSQTVFDKVVEYFNPTSENSLYSAFYEKQSAVTDSSDPAKRFVSETSENGYCSVDAEEISALAQSIGLETYGDINTADCYYYDGYYYFKSAESEQQQNSLVLQVSESKKSSSSDNEYYVTCDVYDESAQKDENGSYIGSAESQLYFLVEYDEENDEWILEKLSSKPLINQSTETDDEEATAQTLSYEIQKETFNATTSDGKVYASYVVEYPLFENNGTTALTINSIYQEIIIELKNRCDETKVDKRYAKFIAGGGSDDDLPVYTHVIASVEYDKDGYISILERKTVKNGKEGREEQTTEETTTSSYYYSTYTTEAATETEAETEKKVAFPQTTYEGYTFEIETGEFVKRDELVGKDYASVQSELFAAWYNAGGRLYPCDNETYGELQTPEYGQIIPSDENGVGNAIYEASWIMKADTIEFMFTHSDYSLEVVSIPRNELEESTVTETTEIETETSGIY